MDNGEELLKNFDKIHTTKLGTERIRRNLSLDIDHVVEWCKKKIGSSEAYYRKKRKKLVYQYRQLHHNGERI